MHFRFASLLVLSFCVAACGGDAAGDGGGGVGGDGIGGAGGGDALPPNEVVRERIEGLAPSANIGHRGTGPTRDGHALPENSIPSFLAAMAEGADGIELDVEITQDGRLIVMHDDDVNRTTNCTGCVSEMTFDAIRACNLLDGAGQPTEEHPPTLDEVYAEVPSPALINVELKVFGPDCLTDTTGPDDLVPLALDEVARLGGENRTIFSSFDVDAVEIVKLEQPEYYSALLLVVTDSDDVQEALLVGQDAIHPRFDLIDTETVQEALDSGLQVNVWTVNDEADMQANIDKGATAIITDFPGVLSELLAN